MAKNTAQKGGLRGFIAPSEEDLYQARKAAELEKFAGRFQQLTGVHHISQDLWADDTGRLWQHDAALEHGTDSAFTVGTDLEAVWFRRPKSGPQTVEQWEVHRDRQAKAAEQQERERQAQLAEARKTAAPVTFAALESSARGVTLAEAARRIANVGGKVEVRGGRLVVSLPPAIPGGTGPVLVFVRMLHTAEAVAVEALSKGQDLPEREITPSGAVV
jgi:hypothetical protein